MTDTNNSYETDLDLIMKRLNEFVLEMEDKVSDAKCGHCGNYAINDKARNLDNTSEELFIGSVTKMSKWKCPRCNSIHPPKSHHCPECDLEFDGNYKVVGEIEHKKVKG